MNCNLKNGNLDRKLNGSQRGPELHEREHERKQEWKPDLDKEKNLSLNGSLTTLERKTAKPKKNNMGRGCGGAIVFSLYEPCSSGRSLGGSIDPQVGKPRSIALGKQLWIRTPKLHRTPARCVLPQSSVLGKWTSWQRRMSSSLSVINASVASTQESTESKVDSP